MQFLPYILDFFDHSEKVKRLTFDSEEFCKYLAFNDRFLKDDVKNLGLFFESFLNSENIQKSSKFDMGINGFTGKMIIKSDENLIRIFVIINKEGNPFIKIGINDSIRTFTNKESLISALSVFRDHLSKKEKTASEKTATDFQGTLNEFLKYCNEVLEKRFNQHKRDGFKWYFLLEQMNGNKYIRLVEGSMILPDDQIPPKSLANFTSKSAWAFINKMNGDILKPNSWSSPSPIPRANIFDKSTWKNVGGYGPL